MKTTRGWSRGTFAGLALPAGVFALLLSQGRCQPARSLLLVSRAIDGGYANGHCYLPNITPDGRYIVFESTASNLVPGDTNGKRDVFLYDTREGTLQRISTSEAGEQGNGSSSYASISDVGRYVGFASGATNLVLDDSNGKQDAVVHDTWTGKNAIVSRNAEGELGNGHSCCPLISADGRFEALISGASNLVPGDNNTDPLGAYTDVFVRDSTTGNVERVSLAYDGWEADGWFAQPFQMTPDARYVLFRSDSTNLVPNDTNGKWDLFVHDRVTNATERVNVGPQGQQDSGGVSLWNTPRITPDGRFVVFSSTAYGWTPEYRAYQVYLRDRVNGTTEWIEFQADPQDGWHADNPAISSDGRYVVFNSQAKIEPDDWDGVNNIYRIDRQTGEIIMVDRDLDGSILDVGLYPVITADGKTVAFESWGPRGATPYAQIYVAIGLP